MSTRVVAIAVALLLLHGPAPLGRGQEQSKEWGRVTTALTKADVKTGQVEAFPRQDDRFYFEAVQVLGDEEALVRAVTVWRRMIGNAVVGTEREDGAVYYARGFSTAGVIDGGRIRLEGRFQVSGTKRYKTARGGSRTVFLLEPAP